MSRCLSMLVPLALVALPEWAAACAVCGAGVEDDQSRVAYLITSALLSALPLALFGGILLWLRRQHRRQSGARPQTHPH